MISGLGEGDIISLFTLKLYIFSAFNLPCSSTSLFTRKARIQLQSVQSINRLYCGGLVHLCRRNPSRSGIVWGMQQKRKVSYSYDLYDSYDMELGSSGTDCGANFCTFSSVVGIGDRKNPDIYDLFDIREPGLGRTVSYGTERSPIHTSFSLYSGHFHEADTFMKRTL